MELIIVDLNKELIDIETLYINLPIDVQRRVNRYKIEDDKKRSIIAWNIVHQKLDLKNNKVFYNENGKPFIDNKYFSISHSHNLVGVLFNDDECGLDIELITKRYDKLADRILTKEEKEEYNKNPEFLIKKWTMIEAFCKGIGTGFRFDLVNDLPSNIITDKIIDTLNNKYYYSIWFKKE